VIVAGAQPSVLRRFVMKRLTTFSQPRGVGEAFEVQRDDVAHQTLDLIAAIADNGHTGKVGGVRPSRGVACS